MAPLLTFKIAGRQGARKNFQPLLRALSIAIESDTADVVALRNLFRLPAEIFRKKLLAQMRHVG
ncbi:hypothetical protein [Rhizobium mesoamericanum]|uniref:Uncharacterized protein n=1 Tax=Rhizobium mesoamericanum STM3625 TaxID=1211777 RepID=K0PYB0_9HYPH|nr:hypothetical protein [Rhizobium mesoamericanum]CCM78948.1 hypothetical protein BN77_p11646 [Rhizobium mesoamericanum STM3625]